MNLNLYPQMTTPNPPPGILAIQLQLKDYAIVINSTSLLFKNLFANNANTKFIVGSLDTLNFSSLKILSKELIANDNFEIIAPNNLSEWFKALIIEENYDNDYLKKLDITKYDTEFNNILISNDEIKIEYISEINSFSKYILNISLPNSELVCFYCEVLEILDDFPLCMKFADILFLNLLNINLTQELEEKLLVILKNNNIKSAIFNTNAGIMLTLPQSVPLYRELNRENSYEMDLLNIKCKVFHQKYSSMTRSSVLPIVIEDDVGISSVLLGLNYKTILFYQQVLANKYETLSFILPESNYKDVLQCVNLSEHMKLKTNILCGQYMSLAIESLKTSTANPMLSKNNTNDVDFTVASINQITRHIIGNFEFVMIPYKNNSTSYISRIQDLQTGEFLVFTENTDNLLFLEKTLKGISTLVFALHLGKNHNDETNSLISSLQQLQNNNNIPRLIIMSQLETLFFDLDLNL